MNTVFVYGTLKKGWGNNTLLANSTYKGAGTVKGTLINLGSFPALLKEGDSIVHGELYDVTDAILSMLDMLEGHPYFYKRELMNVKHDTSGDILTKVWAYCVPEAFRQSHTVIMNGNWRGEWVS